MPAWQVNAWISAGCLAWACIPVSWIFAGLAYADGNGRVGIACALAYPAFLVVVGTTCAAMAAYDPREPPKREPR